MGPKSSSFALTVLLVVLNVGLLLYFVHRQSNELTGVRDSLRQDLQGELLRRDVGAVPTEAAQRITNQLSYLELRQTAVLDEARSSIQRQASVFTTVAAFFGLFTIFFGYRQLLTDTRGSETREKHDQEMRGLVQSFQSNITTISSLITALEETFRYRKQIQEELETIRGRAADLERHQTETDTALETSIDALNRDAVSVVPLAMDRVALSFEENRRTLQAFAARMESVAGVRNLDGRLNPFCYYVRGLSYVTTYQYTHAIADFEVASRRGKEEVTEPNLKVYAREDRERLAALLADMLMSCGYFQGVCHKNVGQYDLAAARFREALARNPDHYDSLAYLLQVTFFDANVPFHDVEAEFEKRTEDLRGRLDEGNQADRERVRHAMQVIEINYGDIYHRKALSPAHRAAYRKHEDPAKAVHHYWRAFDLLPNELSRFALAQALEQVGSSSWRTTTPEKLYAETLTMLKSRVAGEDDKLYAVFQYYMLAACATKLRERAAVAEVFLSQARHSLKEVPQNVTCMSPISRIRLTRPQILAEMEEFESVFQEKPAYVA